MKKIKCNECKWTSRDIKNASGALTKHLIKHNMKSIGRLFTIINCDDVEKLKCPLCNWSSIDTKNKSGVFTNHIKKLHNISPEEFLQTYKNYNHLWKTLQNNILNKKFILSKEENSIMCLECNRRFKKLTNKHLSKHNLTPSEYKEKYNVMTTCSKTTENIQRKKSFDSQIDNVFDRIAAHDCIPLFDKKSYTGVSDNKKYKFKCVICDYQFEDTLDDGKFPICRICNPKLEFHPNKKAENELFLFLKECIGDKILVNDRTLIYPKEVDFYIPHINLAIEFDGLYWHSEKYKTNKYHLEKTLLLKSKNIRTIHIFEDEWNDKKELVKKKIKHILNVCKNNRIYVKNCIIKEISSSICNDFLNQHHIQGSDTSYLKLGLYNNEQLVSVMTFSKPRVALGNRGGENFIELSRFASHTNYNVVGGAGKLFSYFIKKYKPNRVISYADLRWSSFDNNLYERLNFKKISTTSPNYFWCKNGRRFHRFNFTKGRLVKMGYDKTKTESQIMQELGYYRIWDCGHLKYEWML